MGKIRINNMKVYTYNGALKEERVLGQTLEIDIELTLPLEKAGQSDDLNQTISYAEVYDKVTAYCTNHSFALIEALAAGIIECLVSGYRDVLQHVRIRIRKYHVPIAGFFDNVEIEMERSVQ